MVTRNIKCVGCDYEGKIEAHDTIDGADESDLFETLGKDPSTGFLYFRCPSCNEDIAVDPIKAIRAKQMLGFPPSQLTSGRSGRSNRYVPIILGFVSIIAAIFIVVSFRGWWTYIVGGILLMFGWPSLKTGLFASNKEIEELTEPDPISEETTRMFHDVYWDNLNIVVFDKFISEITTLESSVDIIFPNLLTAVQGTLVTLFEVQKSVNNTNLKKKIKIEEFSDLYTILLCYFSFLFYTTNPPLKEEMKEALLEMAEEPNFTKKILQSLEKTSTKSKKLDMQRAGSKVWKEITAILGPNVDSSASQLVAFTEVSVDFYMKAVDEITESLN